MLNQFYISVPRSEETEEKGELFFRKGETCSIRQGAAGRWGCCPWVRSTARRRGSGKELERMVRI